MLSLPRPLGGTTRAAARLQLHFCWARSSGVWLNREEGELRMLET